MNTRIHTSVGHEILHWLWLWTLAATAIIAVTSGLGGQQTQPIPAEDPAIENAMPIPMPNIDDPDAFHYPQWDYQPGPVLEVTLEDILRLNQEGDFNSVIAGWQNMRMDTGSQTWKDVGLAVAYLRMEMVDEAIMHLSDALDHNPNNAVAEYFLGCVRMEQAKGAPFWYDMNDKSPFRLAKLDLQTPNRQPADHAVQGYGLEGQEGRSGQPQRDDRTFLPSFKGSYEKRAEHHFRRAIELAQRCNIDQPLRVIGHEDPVIQLASFRSGATVTVRDLLRSLGEEDYVAKSHMQVGDLLAGRGSFQEAEQSFDNAQQGGLNMSNRYVELGKRLESRGQSRDATRVYVKALQGNPSLTGVLADAFRTLIDSM